MNVNILRHYFRHCKTKEIEPTFKGLKEYQLLTIGLVIPK